MSNPYNTVISYPVPPYSNPPIEPQYYKPSQFPITAITLGQTTIVTMGNGINNVSPNYVIGQEIRLLIPSKYGSRSLNEMTGIVISIPEYNQVEVTINSTQADPFISSPVFLPFQSRTLPQILAIGDINTGAINARGPLHTYPTIPGAFIDISPN